MAKVFVVMRRLHIAGGQLIQFPVIVKSTEELAKKAAQEEAMQLVPPFQQAHLVYPVQNAEGKQGFKHAGTNLQSYMAALGIEGFEHVIVAMDVSDSDIVLMDPKRIILNS